MTPLFRFAYYLLITLAILVGQELLGLSSQCEAAYLTVKPADRQRYEADMTASETTDQTILLLQHQKQLKLELLATHNNGSFSGSSVNTNGSSSVASACILDVVNFELTNIAYHFGIPPCRMWPSPPQSGVFEPPRI